MNKRHSISILSRNRRHTAAADNIDVKNVETKKTSTTKQFKFEFPPFIFSLKSFISIDTLLPFNGHVFVEQHVCTNTITAINHKLAYITTLIQYTLSAHKL